MRALPTSYTFNSIYALFPFATPELTKKIFTELGIAEQYDFSRPKPSAPWRTAFTHDAVLNILGAVRDVEDGSAGRADAF